MHFTESSTVPKYSVTGVLIDTDQHLLLRFGLSSTCYCRFKVTKKLKLKGNPSKSLTDTLAPPASLTVFESFLCPPFFKNVFIYF